MRRALYAVALVVSVAASAAASPAVDDFRFPNARAAAAAWRAVDGSPPPRVAADGLAFTIPFDGDRSRVYWDRHTDLNLSAYTSFALDLTCDHPETMRSLALYFRSGPGWYIWNQPLPQAGRQRLLLQKEDFRAEGVPAGWDKVDRIRISPWKGSPGTAQLVCHSLTGIRDSVFVITATDSAPTPEDRALSERTVKRVSGWLRHAGIPHASMTEDQYIETLPAARVIVMPYSPRPGAPLVAALRRASQSGTALVVCYSDSTELADLVEVTLGDYRQSEETGRWAAMVFDGASEWRVPERVFQHSWSLRVVQPAKSSGRVLARWANAAGVVGDEPAWIATPRGLWMTHILLDDDRAGKERMLIGLLGRYDAAVWAAAADEASRNVGRIDRFSTMGDAIDGIRRLARRQPREGEVEDKIQAAVATRREMIQHEGGGRHADVVDAAASIRRLLSEAYSIAQPPRTNEFRGVWEHDGVGWYPGDWDRTCRELKDAGINALFVNTAWGGLAHYPSTVLPQSGTFRRLGDQMKASIDAARKHGLQIHAWKVLWQLGNAPAEFRARLRGEGRLQLSADGRVIDWMNPALPANREHEIASLVELAKTYDLDGIHLDYVRYPGADADFSPASRKAFESWLGRAMSPWPAAVRSTGAQQDFRRWRTRTITTFVRDARKAVRDANPAIRMSAAVWGGYPDTIASIGQDWGLWMKDGTLDFFCPMNYTEDPFRFSALLQKQLDLPGANGRIFPGIGVTSADSQLRPDEVIEQIAILRRLGAPGFMLYDLSQTLRQDVLPVLGLGATR